MSALLVNPPSCSSWSSKSIVTAKCVPPLMKNTRTMSRSRIVPVKAWFFDSIEQEPILKEALKEPVAFMGGMFAGLLRLDLNDDPLKEWLQRTVEASGVTEEVINAYSRESEDEEIADCIREYLHIHLWYEYDSNNE